MMDKYGGKIRWVALVIFALVSMTIIGAIATESAKACWYESEMYAGNAKNHEECGTVTIDHSHSAYRYFTVHFETSGDWEMTETNLAVANSYEDLPQTKSGNPKIGNFPYSGDHDPAVTYVKYTIDMEDYLGKTYIEGRGWRYVGTYYFAAHAVVYNTEEDREETSWANTGDSFTGNSWALYFTVTFP